MKVLVSAAVLAVAASASAGAATGDTHHKHHRHQLPDLKISKGSLAASNGTISGSFVVKNAGKRSAKKSQAVVLIAAGSKPTVVQVYAVHALKPGGTEEEGVSEPVPTGLPNGTFAIRACADYKHTVKEKSQKNDCTKVGTVTVSSGPTGPTGPTGPVSTVPTNPANLAPDTPTFFEDGRGQYQGQPDVPNTDEDFTSGYWTVVPKSYDASNQTPITPVVWLHGCGGQARYDVSDVSTGVSDARQYIVIAPSGPEAGADDQRPQCWDVNNDVPKVMADIAQAETEFNINRRRVIIAGYSSGGDLAYRTIFYNADTFAGILAMNTSPFRDTGSSQAQSLAAASWKFNVVHIAHVNDDTYPLAGVTTEIQAMKDAGFPADFTTRPGTHYDPDNCPPATTNCIGTTYDEEHYLLPHVDTDGWLAPAQ
jgi:predicted esterase